MTSGEKLVKELGLEKYRNVYISYVIGSSPDIYVVLWDSLRPNMPISRQYLQTYSNIDFYKRGKRLHISSPFDLRRSNSNLGTGTILTYDIAMSNMTRREATGDSERVSIDIDDLIPLTEKRGTQKLYTGKLTELTLKDLKDAGREGISNSTFDWFTDRNKLGYTGAKSIKLIDANISEADNSFTFYFLCEATEGQTDLSKARGYDYDDPKSETKPKNFKLSKNPSKTYEIQIKFLDLREFVEYLKTKPDKDNVTQKDIDYLISVMDIQYFSSSPSFNYQGYANVATQLGLSIFKQDIVSKRWMPQAFKGEYYLDKHLYSFVQSYKFFSQQMAQMIGKKLRDRGLI